MPASLRVDGMATVLVDDLRQVVDPLRPNRNRRANEQLGTLAAGDRVFLVATLQTRRDLYWQLPSMGWIAQDNGDRQNIEPYQPPCPTTFPLSAADLGAISRLEALACFGNTELTLSGTVICNRPTKDYTIGGASFLDANRSCRLDDELELNGEAVTSILETPTPVQDITGRYLVRGHFDDPEAQNCHSIPFGTSPGVDGLPPEPEHVLSCRQIFVVSNVTELD